MKAEAADPDEVVRLEDVKRHYTVGDETVKALDGVSFSIRRGSYWAIMGPSGSGKSTLLNILGCLDRPTQGHYWLNGADVAGMDDNQLSDHRLRNLGFVFQSFHLIPQLTVLENIEMPMFYLGLSLAERRRRAEELAEKVGMAHRLQHLPAELSGGQRQRVAIARAVAKSAGILIFDDASSALDLKTEAHLHAALKEAFPGQTRLVIAQRIATVRQADRIVLLEHGVIAASGTHAELLRGCAAYRDIYDSQMEEAEHG